MVEERLRMLRRVEKTAFQNPVNPVNLVNLVNPVKNYARSPFFLTVTCVT